jgi:hypothetical protein
MSEKPKVFISYRGEDGRDQAEKQAIRLTSAGHDTWLDRQSGTEGRWFGFEIERRIAKRTCVVACLTSSSGNKEKTWFRRELLYAKHIALKPIIPVAFPEAEPPNEISDLIPLGFNTVVGEDPLYDALLADLLREIEKSADKRDPLNPLDDPFRPYLGDLYRRTTDQLESMAHRLLLTIESSDSPDKVAMCEFRAVPEACLDGGEQPDVMFRSGYAFSLECCLTQYSSMSLRTCCGDRAGVSEWPQTSRRKS